MRLSRLFPLAWLPLAFVATLAVVGFAIRHAGAAPQPAAAARLPLIETQLQPEGGLGWEVRDADTGQPIPCKLTLLGVDGTTTPQFTRKDIGRAEGDTAVAAYNRVFASVGLGVAHVPVGVYDVYVSRGPEWDMVVAHKVRIELGKSTKITANLKHAVDTTHWISGDFHVHSAMSTDSRVPMSHRIFEFLSEGVEVIVSTDHNVVSDYAPIIQEMGVGDAITSIVGDEMTTGGWGHFGAFPLPQDLEMAGHGAILVHGRNAADFCGDVRRVSRFTVIDVHHPRIDNEIGYFNLAKFDAKDDKPGRPGWSYDFDAVEVVNGYQDSERKSIDRVLQDWYYLLDHGHIVTGTGNSDTHHLTYNLGGYPRNYVRVLDDRPTAVKPERLAEAIKAHRVIFSTGPFVRFNVNGADVGDTAAVTKGEALVDIEVQAANWVSVSSVSLIQNGAEVMHWNVPPTTSPLRFKTQYHLPVTRDGWVLVRVDGNQPLSPVVGDLKHYDVRPFAMTNPIFLDVNGNGAFDAPFAQPAVETKRR